MTGLSCLRAELLVERRAAGLSPADALRLEDHLASCEHCSRQAEFLSRLRTELARGDVALTSIERERAITDALRGVRPGSVAPRRIAAAFPFLAGGLVTAAAVVVGFALRGWLAPAPGAEPVVAHRPVQPAAGDRVLLGAIEVAGRAAGEGTAIADGAQVHSAGAATVALAHAQVELRPQTTLSWQRAARRVRLHAGSLMAEVDPAAHAPFAIETERFVVMVLGTRFEVSERTVSVVRGRVRVLDKAGAELATLGAGERFDADATAAVPASEPQPEPARTARRPQRVREDVEALLDGARNLLAERRVDRARDTIDRALALQPAVPLRAEALSLRAECALVAGDAAGASAAYLHVARSFARLPAGENALFAAARIERERGASAQAARILEQYLERYPDGRFAKEARNRLADSSKVVQPQR